MSGIDRRLVFMMEAATAPPDDVVLRIVMRNLTVGPEDLAEAVVLHLTGGDVEAGDGPAGDVRGCRSKLQGSGKPYRLNTK